MRSETVDRIIQEGAAAVIRLPDPDRFFPVAEALEKGGLGVIEITMTVPGAVDLIRKASREMGDRILLGAGSVLDAESAKRCIDAGARFVVSPIIHEETIRQVLSLDVPMIPGAFSPSEIQRAHQLGADIVKIFPAQMLGMDYIRAVKAPLPHLRIMPTGGVTLTNAGEWLMKGACAVGIGSALLNKQAIAERNYGRLTENARILMQNIRAARRTGQE